MCRDRAHGQSNNNPHGGLLFVCNPTGSSAAEQQSAYAESCSCVRKNHRQRFVMRIAVLPSAGKITDSFPPIRCHNIPHADSCKTTPSEALRQLSAWQSVCGSLSGSPTVMTSAMRIPCGKLFARSKTASPTDIRIAKVMTFSMHIAVLLAAFRACRRQQSV